MHDETQQPQPNRMRLFVRCPRTTYSSSVVAVVLPARRSRHREWAPKTREVQPAHSRPFAHGLTSPITESPVESFSFFAIFPPRVHKVQFDEYGSSLRSGDICADFRHYLH
ncbi:unnamed protein product [Scytosiphon promiscuus]